MGTACTTPTGSPSITHRYRTFHLHCHHQGIHQDHAHQKHAPPLTVLYTRQAILGMMAAAERIAMAENESGSMGTYLNIKTKTLELLDRAGQLCQPEDRSATRCICTRPRPPPPLIAIPPAHFDLHHTDIAAHRQSPYIVTGIADSIA